MKITTRLFLFCGLGLAMASCKDDIDAEYQDYTAEEYELLTQKLDLPQGVYNYSPQFDDEFFINHLGHENIQIRRANHKATLGRVLFYDNNLSINDAVSCASCHKQELAFADDVAFSEGFDGEITTRNSLPLGNTIGFETSYGGSFAVERALFSWDEANEDISTQSLAAITSTIEMGLNMNQLISKLNKEEHYKILFKKAYGDDNVMSHRVLESIEEFVNGIVSSNSKFDKASMNAHGNLFSDFPTFSAEENRGKAIYMNNCASCHSQDHQFTEVAKANNGLDLVYEDKGVGDRTLRSADNGVFKVPFLRNIELTGPYMHDGRFETLDEVIDHYSDGIQNHQNLDSKLKVGNSAVKMNFSAADKAALKAYLLTLTDQEMIADVKFSDPFK